MENLLIIIKDHLRIAWDDEDEALITLIKRAQANLEELVGLGLDFEKEGLAQALLINYVRYDYNNALEYFEENFRKEILRLQLQEAAKDRDRNDSGQEV